MRWNLIGNAAVRILGFGHARALGFRIITVWRLRGIGLASKFGHLVLSSVRLDLNSKVWGFEGGGPGNESYAA